jgi:hypothetical protein
MPVGLAAIVASFFLLIGGGDNRINKWNYYKIKDGMTEEEVEAVLGPEVAKAVVIVPDKPPELPLFTETPGQWEWTTEECVIVVVFDENKRVIRKYYLVAFDPWRESSWYEEVRFSVRRIMGW